jgi:hypothetical protein
VKPSLPNAAALMIVSEQARVIKESRGKNGQQTAAAKGEESESIPLAQMDDGDDTASGNLETASLNPATPALPTTRASTF